MTFRPGLRYYLSLILLFLPGFAFAFFLAFLIRKGFIMPENHLFYFPWQFWLIAMSGVIGTIGGVLDWRYHRDPLKLKISRKEREAEAKALGLGGVPMLLLMIAATLMSQPQLLLIPIILVLLYTVVAICYDEFVFHIHRCDSTETIFHRMLVFGNGAAWLAWFHFIFV